MYFIYTNSWAFWCWSWMIGWVEPQQVVERTKGRLAHKFGAGHESHTRIKLMGADLTKQKKKNASFVFSFLLLHRKLRWKFASMGPTTISPILPHFRLNQTTSLLHFQCFSSLSTFTRTKHNIRERISKLNIQPSFSIRSTNILFAL